MILAKNAKTGLQCELYQGSLFLEWANVKEIVALSMVESVFISADKVKNILIDSINQFEQKEGPACQLKIEGNLTYFLLKNRNVVKQININDII